MGYLIFIFLKGKKSTKKENCDWTEIQVLELSSKTIACEYVTFSIP